MTFATLRALHTVIGDALAEMERIYAARSAEAGGRPLDYPSLDVPYYHNGGSTGAEADTAEKLAAEADVVMAANHIVAACEQLAASVHRPFFTLMEGLMSVSRARCHLIVIIVVVIDEGDGGADVRCMAHIGTPDCVLGVPRGVEHRRDPPRGGPGGPARHGARAPRRRGARFGGQEPEWIAAGPRQTE